MRCTAASSKRGGACSAQTLVAVVCGARLDELMAELSKALWSVLCICPELDEGAVPVRSALDLSLAERPGLLCYEVAQVLSAVVCVHKVGRGANAGVQNRPLQCIWNLKFCQQCQEGFGLRIL